MSKRGYLGTIVSAARTTAEGLAVTLAQYFRRPTTVQYPDRLPVPLEETLPERYRGFLEVDIELCTACKACERDCPIDCIVIDVEKVEEQRVMTRFDIDLGKCMYCGICVESCPVPAQAPGDAEPTKTIRMTREFEGATSSFESLTFRFIAPGTRAPLYKPKKGEVPPTKARGEIARSSRAQAAEHNPIAIAWARTQRSARPVLPVADVIEKEAMQRRADELAPRVADCGDDRDRLATLIREEALAGTDCEACGHPNCAAYAQAIASGSETALHKCEPGGPQATRDATLIVQLRAGATPSDAVKAAAKAVVQHHKK